MILLADSKPSALEIYRRLRKRFGYLDWWPGETSFEVLVGAILTQNTSWKNVERAIANLKAEDCLDLGKMCDVGTGALEKMLRPSGYFRQKAGRLKSICNRIRKDYGTLENFYSLDQDELREKLLSMKGIGKETADSIVLYSAEKPTFVIDTYTRRSMSRIMKGTLEGDEAPYDDLKSYFETNVPRRLSLYKDFHAQLVELGKNYCKKRNPLCRECPLIELCRYGNRAAF